MVGAMRPLRDVRIIAVEQYGAGPFGTLQLADLGADIIKVEDPRSGGDVGRTVPPFAEGEDSLFFEAFNRGKRSISLDLTNDGGRAVFEDLVRGADAVFSNLRGDATARLRLRYADLAPVNPRIVCCALTAFALDGPRASEPGYDYLMQGLAGWMSLTGEPDAPPTKTGPVGGRLRRGTQCGARVGRGSPRRAARRCGLRLRRDDVRHRSRLVGLPRDVAPHCGVRAGANRAQRAPESRAVPELRDCRRMDRRRLCEREVLAATGRGHRSRADLASDDRYTNFDGRRRHAGELLPELRSVFATRPTGEWLEILPAAGVPCAPVNTVAQGLVEHRASGGDADRDRTSALRHGASRRADDPRRSRRQPSSSRRPLVGSTRSRCSSELGYDHDTIDELRRTGAFGDTIDPLPTQNRGIS